MLEAMKQLALDFLWNHEGSGEPPDDLESWFKDFRQNAPEKLFQYLVESTERMERYYTLSPDKEDPDLAVLEALDFKESDNIKLPFNQSSGSQGAALGPVIKRTYSNAKGAGPSAKIQKTTLDSFEAIGESDEPWSLFFKSALNTWTRPKLLVRARGDKLEGSGNAYAVAIEQIPEKKTVFLAFKSEDGRLPGEHPEYMQYLQAILANTKYATKAVPPVQGGRCSLCGSEPATVFCNALRGAGLNISNVDRPGAFPDVTIDHAVRGYPLCLDCADLLYVYKNRIARLFIAPIAGDRALIVPRTRVSGRIRQRFFKQVADLTTSPSSEGGKQPSLRAGIETREERLMRLLGDERAVTSFDILWADFGQKIENLRGAVTDVLPSRLSRISEINDCFRDTRSPLFPEHDLAVFDLPLTFVLHLLRRPGGKKAQSINESRRMFQLRREVAAAIYSARSFSLSRFWDEMFITARWYLNEAISKGDGWGLLTEGYSEKKQTSYWTMAGWIRHLARFIHYLTTLEVFPMPDAMYHPQSDLLRPYFRPESGIDTVQKAFAFILGILYGKVMQVQAAKGFNVGANALTWLKRLTLTGKDLPELYCKVREKLLTYETESSSAVREVLQELGSLGAKIGDNFDLPQVTTCYFLLLGQSVAVRVLPSKEETSDTTRS